MYMYRDSVRWPCVTLRRCSRTRRVWRWAARYTRHAALARHTAWVRRARIVSAHTKVTLAFVQVDLFEHGLQTATRCYNDVFARTKADTPQEKAALTPAGLSKEDEELVVVALLHDIGETLSPINHGEVAAGILRPFISPRNYWILMHHEIFQFYYYGKAAGADDHTLREQFRDSPHFDACEEFCLKWDQAAFDGDFECKELDFFVPMVHRVFSRPVYAHDQHKEDRINKVKAQMANGYPTEVAG